MPIDCNHYFFLMINYNDIHVNIFSHVPGFLIHFLEHGTGTAVSDHFGLIVFTEQDKQTTGRAVCYVLWHPFPCRKHRYNSVVIRVLVDGIFIPINEQHLLVVHTNVHTVYDMVTVRWRFPWRSYNFSSLLAPPIHTFLSSVTAMSKKQSYCLYQRRHLSL